MKVFILIIMVSLLTACGGNLAAVAENAIYPYASANKIEVPEAAEYGFESTYLNIQSPSLKGERVDLLKVQVWYAQGKSDDLPVVIYAHGNGTNLGGLAGSMTFKKLKEFGVHIVAFDYPSYGNSTGKVNQENLTNSGIATMEWAKRRFGKDKVIVWGRSLGAAVAAQMAARKEDSVLRLIMTSGWHDLMSVALEKTNLAKQIPESWAKENEWHSGRALMQFRQPVMFQHGDKDTLIPIKFGQQNFRESASQQKSFITITGTGHNDVFLSDLFWQSLKDFILN